MRRLLIVANETVAGGELLDAIERRARGGALDITVLCPINEPRGLYVVDPDAVRGAASERLERTLHELRDNGIEARGFVVEQMRRFLRDIPLEHVVVDQSRSEVVR